MKLVFVSGKYRGKTWDEIEENIQTARQASIKLWQLGFAVICPHLNTAHFDGLANDSVWLEGDLEMLGRCDAIYLLDNWIDSEGAKAEYKLAVELGLAIITEREISSP